MNNTSPFSFLESIANQFQPPAWMVEEGQQRLVLFLNHVLLQEKQAQDRLLRQKGRVVHLRWGVFAIDLLVTPAGLVDRAPLASKPDLVLSVAAESPLIAVQSMLAGKTPPVKIEGDVQLAAEIGWLAENLRWDVEEDLSRLIGDAPAYSLVNAGRRLAASLKEFLSKVAKPPSAPPPAAHETAPAASVTADKKMAVSPVSLVSQAPSDSADAPPDVLDAEVQASTPPVGEAENDPTSKPVPPKASA